MTGEYTKTYIRDTWSSSWVYHPELEAQRITLNAGPNHSTAQILYRYGCKVSTTTYIDSPQSLNGKFIKVTSVNNDIEQELFAGIIPVRSDAISGKILSSLGYTETGNQMFTAYDMTYLIDRIKNITAGVLNDDTNTITKYVDHVPTINLPDRTTGRTIGNRSTQLDSYGVYRYGTANNLWTHYEYLRTILKEASRITGIDFELVGQTEELNKIITVQDVDGLSLREVLNRLVQARYGFGWVPMPIGDGTSVSIRIFTVTPTDISVGSSTIAANDLSTTVQLVNNASNYDITLGESITSKWDRIVAYGERMLSCFTLTKTDWEENWTSQEELAYNTAASGTAGYAGLTTDEQNALNDAYRSTDQLNNVYQSLALPDDWDWTINGERVNYEVDDLGQLVYYGNQPSYYNAGKALSGFIPYVDSNNEYRPAFAVVEIDGKNYYLDRISESLKDTTQSYPNVGLAMLSNNLGITLKSRPNHVMGLNHFTDTATNTEPVYDYEDVQITVAVRTDQRIKVTATVNYAGDNELGIYVPDTELWYALKDTVIDVNADGTLNRVTDLPISVLRDDRGILQSIAAAAKAWYGKERRALEYSLRYLSSPAYPGIMLTGVFIDSDYSDVNTVVTQVMYDCVNRNSTVRTDYEGVDFNSILGSVANNNSSLNTLSKQIRGVQNAITSFIARQPISSNITPIEPADLHICVLPLEQPQSDGKMAVKKLESTLSATVANSAFDINLVYTGASVTLSGAVWLNIGLSAQGLTLFTSSLTGPTRLFVEDFDPYGYCSVMPIFQPGDACEE